LNSVPKGVSERRVILDLSWPAGSSVNDGISSKQFLGAEFDLVYPTVDDIASLIIGSNCLLFKRDLKRAYRQFPIDPGDYHFLGYLWRKKNIIATSFKEKSTVVSIENICATPQLPLMSETFVISGNLADRRDKNKLNTAYMWLTYILKIHFSQSYSRSSERKQLCIH
jgi:hypothetical protein